MPGNGLILPPAARDKLRAAVARRGLTHDQVAESAGLPRPKVTAMLAGSRSARIETWDTLAGVLGYRLELLLRRAK